jgi:hypothetical protein
MVTEPIEIKYRIRLMTHTLMGKVFFPYQTLENLHVQPMQTRNSKMPMYTTMYTIVKDVKGKERLMLVHSKIVEVTPGGNPHMCGCGHRRRC